MGFDPSNITRQIIGQQIRNENYEKSSEHHQTQKSMILYALSKLNLTNKKNNKLMYSYSTPSRIYNYLLKYNFITNKTPLTSIRARLSEMANPKKENEKQILVEFDKENSVIYDSTETVYTFKKMKEINNQTTLY